MERKSSGYAPAPHHELDGCKPLLLLCQIHSISIIQSCLLSQAQNKLEPYWGKITPRHLPLAQGGTGWELATRHPQTRHSTAREAKARPRISG